MKITLRTRDGGFVRDVEIPPFHPPPKVVTWGSRIYVLAETPAAAGLSVIVDTPVYVEDLLYPVEVADAYAETGDAQAVAESDWNRMRRTDKP